MRTEEQAASRSIPILIVDDHEMARRSFRAILETEPDLHVVAEASNGLEAVEKAAACAPVVVLMDIGMAEMNGMEATRRLHHELPDIDVLIVTMHFSEELVKEAMLAGAKGYLLKTDVDRELIAAIRTLCRHESYFSSHCDDMWASGAPSA